MKYKSVIITRKGSPDVLKVIENDLRESAPNEARIKILATGVGRTDVIMRYGYYPYAPKIPFAPGYNVPFAARVKKEAGIPVMAVGMITRARQAEQIIASGEADMVAIARAMMDDPRWAWHAARELEAQTPYAPNYQRCHPSVWKP